MASNLLALSVKGNMTHTMVKSSMKKLTWTYIIHVEIVEVSSSSNFSLELMSAFTTRMNRLSVQNVLIHTPVKVLCLHI